MSHKRQCVVNITVTITKLCPKRPQGKQIRKVCGPQGKSLMMVKVTHDDHKLGTKGRREQRLEKTSHRRQVRPSPVALAQPQLKGAC